MAIPVQFTILLAFAAIFSHFTAPSFATNVLPSSVGTLRAGYSLDESSYHLVMQHDCNLVLYDATGAVWATQTQGKGSGCYLSMQSDGNLVIYDNKNSPVWASNTGGQANGNFILVLQPDRNVVVYGPAIWATNTNIQGTPGVVITKLPSKNFARSSVI